MKTLVIHPADVTTDFLKPIYEGRDWTVMNSIKSNKEMIEAIKAHDRIIFMGHGFEFGFADPKRGVIVGPKHVYLLREKICYGIWCNADVFFKKYKLKGFYTGIIISEFDEAYHYGVPFKSPQIVDPNALFTASLVKYIDHDDVVDLVRSEYVSEDNNIIKFNRENLYKNI